MEDGSGPVAFKEIGIQGIHTPNMTIPFALDVLSI
jgi:hypothetical protein